MAIIFVPINGGVQTADALSRGVYKLSQPDGVRPEGYATEFAFAWITHPTSGAVALSIDTAETIPLHPEAVTADLLTLIEPLTTQTERDQLDAYVKANAGSRVPMAALVPPQAMALAMTRAQATAAGWFNWLTT